LEEYKPEELFNRIQQLEITVESLTKAVEKLLAESEVKKADTSEVGRDVEAPRKATVSDLTRPKPELPVGIPVDKAKFVEPDQSRPKPLAESGAPSDLKPMPSSGRPDSINQFHKPSVKFELPEKMKSIEYWIGRVGIALLLFGVIFLFKYSIDQGWITPWIRIGFGLALGGVLIILGLRIVNTKRVFANLLFGGGIATLYIIGFAAFQTLELVSQFTAMGFMIVVTITAFALSLKYNEAILSIIASLGGFGTPFLLYSSSGNLPGLVIYACVICCGTIGVYFYKGWRSILWLSSLCTWLIFLIGYLSSFIGSVHPPLSHHWSLQVGAIIGWILFWAIPILREIIEARSPGKLTASKFGIGDKKLSSVAKEMMDRHLHLLALSSPLAGMGLSVLVWDKPDSEFWGWISFGVSAVYFSVSYYLSKMLQLRALKYTHLLIALTFLTIGISLVLDGNSLLFTLATEAVILHLIARRLSDNFTSIYATILHLLIGLHLFGRLTEATGDYSLASNSFFDVHTMTDLWVILTLAATAFIHKFTGMKRFFGLFAQAMLALLFFGELDGNLELIAIASEAIVVYIICRYFKEHFIRYGAHGLFGLAAYLLIFRFIDLPLSGTPIFNLAALSDIWVILLMAAIAKFTNCLDIRRIYIFGVVAAVAGLLVREFDSNLLAVLLLTEAVGVAFLAKSMKDKIVGYYSHAFFVSLGLLLIQRLLSARVDSAEIVIVNLSAMVSLLMIGVFVAISKLLSNREERSAYLIVSHLFFLSWLLVELSRLANGQGWVSAAWGVYGAALLIFGLRLNYHKLRLAALGTLILLVGKLFMIDLAKLEAIWRVLLFIGIGGILLTLSYFFQSLWKKDDTSSDA